SHTYLTPLALTVALPIPSHAPTTRGDSIVPAFNVKRSPLRSLHCHHRNCSQLAMIWREAYGVRPARRRFGFSFISVGLMLSIRLIKPFVRMSERKPFVRSIERKNVYALTNL